MNFTLLWLALATFLACFFTVKGLEMRANEFDLTVSEDHGVLVLSEGPSEPVSIALTADDLEHLIALAQSSLAILRATNGNG